MHLVQLLLCRICIEKRKKDESVIVCHKTIKLIPLLRTLIALWPHFFGFIHFVCLLKLLKFLTCSECIRWDAPNIFSLFFLSFFVSFFLFFLFLLRIHEYLEQTENKNGINNFFYDAICDIFQGFFSVVGERRKNITIFEFS